MERKFDAREAEEPLDPVDGLQRNSQRAAPATERARRWITRSRWFVGTEDCVEARRAAAQAGTDARFIEDGGALLDGSDRCATMADDGQSVILLDDVAREVAAGPKLDQRGRSA
ncbi:MAG: hypothetical protein ACO3DS_07935 [Phycisphaerales bacterium]